MTKHKSNKGKKKRGRPPGSKSKPATTVSDAMAKHTVAMIDCEFCGYKFEAALGRYGCPNCNGEGLGDKEKASEAIVIALMAVNPDPARPALRTFPIIPTFGDAGAKHDMAIVLEDSAWVGYCMMTDGHSVWLEPYEG